MATSYSFIVIYYIICIIEITRQGLILHLDHRYISFSLLRIYNVEIFFFALHSFLFYTFDGIVQEDTNIDCVISDQTHFLKR